MFFGEPFGGVIPGAHGAVMGVLLRTDTPLTGRQVHRLLSDDYSLWAIQEALKTLAKIGVITTEQVGRAGVHTINESHAAVAPLRAMADPMATLQETIRPIATPEGSVILFGSIARGESTRDSDIDLAVIAPPDWDKRIDLQDAVRTRLGNETEVLVFTPEEFKHLRAAGEPVVQEILRDGIALTGAIPTAGQGSA